MAGQTKENFFETFAEWYNENHEYILVIILKAVGDFHEAEDLTSEIFLKALQRFEQYDQSKGTLSNWIYGISKNAIIDYYRARKNQREGDQYVDVNELNIASFDRLPEDYLEAKEEVSLIAETLQLFPDIEQWCLRLRFAGYSNREIATQLGVSYSMVGVLLHRARKRLIALVN